MAEDRSAELVELLAEVRRIEVQSRRLVADVMAGGYSSAFRGAGIEFEEVREFVEGDDLRAVDWNVTARTGRPFVKTYTDERERTLVLALDLSASMTGGFGAWSPRQAAARVCAALAFAAVWSDDKVGLIAFSQEVDQLVPAAKGRGHAVRILRDCLLHQGRSAHADIGAALGFAMRVLRRRSILLLVSDFLSSGYEQVLARCARRHDVIAIWLQSPELDAPPVALVRARDPETGTRSLVDFASTRVRGEYAARIDRWRRQTRATLRRAGVDRIEIPIPATKDRDLLARPLLEFFRMRKLRASRP